MAFYWPLFSRPVKKILDLSLASYKDCNICDIVSQKIYIKFLLKCMNVIFLLVYPLSNNNNNKIKKIIVNNFYKFSLIPLAYLFRQFNSINNVMDFFNVFLTKQNIWFGTYTTLSYPAL